MSQSTLERIEKKLDKQVLINRASMVIITTMLHALSCGGSRRQEVLEDLPQELRTQKSLIEAYYQL